MRRKLAFITSASVVLFCLSLVYYIHSYRTLGHGQAVTYLCNGAAIDPNAPCPPIPAPGFNYDGYAYLIGTSCLLVIAIGLDIYYLKVFKKKSK